MKNGAHCKATIETASFLCWNGLQKIKKFNYLNKQNLLNYVFVRHLQLICLTGNEINIDIKQTLSSFLMTMKQTKTMINKRSFIDSSQSQYSWQKTKLIF